MYVYTYVRKGGERICVNVDCSDERGRNSGELASELASEQACERANERASG